MGKLRVAFLGGMQISLDDELVTGYVSNKVPSLFAYLAVTGRAHSRSGLANLLWGDSSTDQARKSLSTALSNLTKLLPAHIVVTRQTVALNRGSDFRLDTEEFLDRVDQTLALRDKERPTVILQALHRALGLYKGAFLEGFYVKDALAFEEWVAIQREVYREALLRALHTAVALSIKEGSYLAGIDYASRLLSAEPWQEESHRQMMCLLALNGQRSAALAQYENCRRILTAELGVEPGRETRDLYEEIRAGNVHRIAARVQDRTLGEEQADAPPDPSAGVERLGEFIHRAACRLYTLVGEDEVERVSLAMAVADRVASDLGHGARYVSLDRKEGAGISPATERPSAATLALIIADALAAPLLGEAEPTERLYAHLRDKEMLLVLEIPDQLLAAGAELALGILQNAPALKLLVSSSECLNLQAECAVAVSDYV